MLDIKSPVQFVPGVGPRMAARFERLSVKTVEDLLRLAPRRYEDLSNLQKISDIVADSIAVIRGKIWEKRWVKTRTGKGLVEATVADQSGTIKAAWFNQRYLLNTLKEDTEYLFAGKVKEFAGSFSLLNPSFELTSGETAHVGRIVAVYPETEGLTSRMIRNAVMNVIERINDVSEPEIGQILRDEGLLNYREALKAAHQPEHMDEARKAKETMAFVEMLVFELKALRLKESYKKDKAKPVFYDVEFVKKVLAELSFEMTGAQKRSLHEILLDMQKSVPMNRLLEGDVGSGKTAVATTAALAAVSDGGQAALMVPTEILSRQHYEKLKIIISAFGFNALLLTGQEARFGGKRYSKKQGHKLIMNGEAQFIIGTHALIQEAVSFKDLRLAVVDEQHRFGVGQRAKLRSENRGFLPHLLTMTATPIPRTLALTLFGDLELSIIDEMPKGRTQIETRVVWKKDERERIYAFIREEIKAGRQAFVVVPLIDESDKVGAKAVKIEHEKLDKEIFPELTVGLLHGKLKSGEKEEVMASFASGNLDVLVSTPVVEVGIDVPNASVMLIESAERFGLSQLHQFRGRVGRGGHQSYCFALAGSLSEETRKRLFTFERNSDGFKLAEEDLKLRGPGEVFGFRQSGLPEFRAADLLDVKLIGKARSAAERLLKEDAELRSYPVLKAQIEHLPFLTLD